MPLKSQSPPINSIELPSKFILVGEDDLDDVDLLREVFSAVDDSYTLIFYHSGRQIIEALDQMPGNKLPCLIVLDYNMPELNGAEILKSLRNSGRYDTVPKIIWSTSGSAVYRKICLELGADDYVTKPSSLQEMSQIARHIISFC